jgi:RNA polymerase sigma-70 factor (ECF subfamily)
MSGIETDADLLAGIRRDDPGAFEEFVNRYGGKILGYGMNVCGGGEDARDVTQDTLMKAFHSLKDVKEPKALRSWLFRVVSNACRMHRRKGKYEPRRELTLEELMPGGAEEASIEIADAARLPDDEVARGEIHQAVHAAIRELPPEYRMVLHLRDIEQLSTHEVAVALDLPEGTVKMRLHRARLMLRKTLADRIGRPAGGKGDES